MQDDYVARNREHWDGQAVDYAVMGRQAWAEQEPTWGIWQVPDAELRALPEQLGGLDVVELGCGTAYFSAWLARRGARPVGVDASPAQLATARELQRDFGLEFPLELGNAERTPFAAGSFDLAISEYGAAIWCDPYKWIPEAARILRPGGELIFLVNSTLMMLAMPDATGEKATERLFRPQRGMHRFEFPDTISVQFHISPGDWIRLLRRSGFDVEDMIEVYPKERAQCGFDWVDLDWARKWPSEEIWKARKRA